MGLDVSSPGLGPSQGRLSLEMCLQVKDQSRSAVVAMTLIYLHLTLSLVAQTVKNLRAVQETWV